MRSTGCTRRVSLPTGRCSSHRAFWHSLTYLSVSPMVRGPLSSTLARSGAGIRLATNPMQICSTVRATAASQNRWHSARVNGPPSGTLGWSKISASLSNSWSIRLASLSIDSCMLDRGLSEARMSTIARPESPASPPKSCSIFFFIHVQVRV